MEEYLKLMIEKIGIPIWLFITILVWSYAWKLAALWKSARQKSVVWFVILALVNTAGILEILYIFVFSKIKCCEFRVKPKRKTAKRKRK